MKRYKDNGYIERIGNRLRYAIDALGMKDSDFAKGAGLSASQISNVITGKQRLGLDAALAIEDTYGVKLDYLYFASLSQLDEKIVKFVSSRPRESWAR